MDGALALNRNLYNTLDMPKTKETKAKVLSEIKNKLESAKLDLIYKELEEANIPFERKYSTVKELRKDLKKNISELDYNNVNSIINRIEVSLNNMVNELEKGSTNAFTKLMTGNLSKTIARVMGITLAGRTALILAPTIGTKAIVAAGLAGYGLYRIVKNRKEIIKVNVNNELNNILMDLETTKDNGKYIETRFDENTQEIIRNYLKGNNINFDDTGYRSLRQAIYNMDSDKKRGLCELLNSKLGKSINIDKRVSSAKRKLNVISSTAASISAGSAIGLQVANTVNSIDPALTAGTLNGTLLDAWFKKIINKKWFTALSSSLGLVGSEILERLPMFGGLVKKVFVVENLAVFASLGVVGGVAVSTGLGFISAAKKIYNYARNKKENEEFLKLDASKYGQIDKVELNEISNKLHETSDLTERVLVDLVYGYLKDNNININGNPKSLYELKELINKLDANNRRKAKRILNNIKYNLDNDPNIIKDIKNLGRISIGLFTTGLATMSIYDIIKGGTVLPELSQKIFQNNNIHTPIEQYPDLNEGIDPKKDQSIINNSKPIYSEFQNNSNYKTIDNGDYTIEYGYNYGKYNPGVAGYSAENNMISVGLDQNFADKVGSWFGIKPKANEIPSIPAICEKLNEMSDKELYEFYRYFNSVQDNSPMYEAVKEALSYNTFLERATGFINSFTKKQELHDLVNDLTNKLSMGIIPFAAVLETLGLAQKRNTNQDFSIYEEKNYKIR